MRKLAVYIYIISFLALSISCNTDNKVDVTIMTFNIRLDAPSDSLNNWKYRKDIAARIVLDNDVDILGTQEVLNNQLNDLKERLPQYNAIGVGREDGKDKGEYAAIFYKTDRFKEIESGNFWLSETPHAAGSKGWDAACERVATWAILEETATHRQLFVMNTHLDHVGQTARKQSINLLLDKMRQLHKGLPIVIMGDFNATPESDIISGMSEGDILVDSRRIAKQTTGTEWTFHDFGRLPIEERELLDYIFVSKNVEIVKYSVLSDTFSGVYVSDHKPVLIKATIK